MIKVHKIPQQQQTNTIISYYYSHPDYLVDEADKKESSLLFSAETLTKYFKSDSLPREAMKEITKKVDKLFATYKGKVDYVPKGTELKVKGKL